MRELVDASTQGFLVDIDGNIQYPRIGKIKADGLTKAQLSEEIRKKLTGPLQNPSVLVHLLNFKITMLGEVSRPGPITIPTRKNNNIGSDRSCRGYN